MVVPPHSLAIGVPAKIRPDASSVEFIRLSAGEYVSNGTRYKEQLRRLDAADDDLLEVRSADG